MPLKILVEMCVANEKLIPKAKKKNISDTFKEEQEQKSSARR